MAFSACMQEMAMKTPPRVPVQVQQQEQEDRRCPDILSPAMPDELHNMVLSNLHAKDLINLSMTNQKMHRLITGECPKLAKALTKTSIHRIKHQQTYLDFTNVSLITAWRRYNSIYGMTRISHHYPAPGTFISAFLAANPRFRKTAAELSDAMKLLLGFSDWYQWYCRGTRQTPLAELLNSSGWRDILRNAAMRTGPAYYQDLVVAWRSKLDMNWSSAFIVRSFEELMMVPIEDLRSCVQISPLQARFYYGEEGFVGVRANGHEELGVVLPECLREKMVEVPVTVNGYQSEIGTATARGKKLIEVIRETGDPSGMMFALLLEREVEVWWL